MCGIENGGEDGLPSKACRQRIKEGRRTGTGVEAISSGGSFQYLQIKSKEVVVFKRCLLAAKGRLCLARLKRLFCTW